jgi:DNA-binding MarR family transcriptional regulator
MRKPKMLAKPRFAYDGLSRVIHERARLSLITSLVTHAEGLRFTDLKELCGLTDGNLNRHLAVLDEAKFISIVKTSDGTRCRITALGRKRYLEYLAVLDQVISDAAIALNDRDRSTDLAKVLS